MPSRTVLIVAPTRPLAAAWSAWLTGAGHRVDVVTSFPDAKARLKSGPTLMISEVRLGDFNGLHLAIRALAEGIPAVVIGAPDTVLQREAERLGALYLTSDLDQADLLRAVDLLPRAIGLRQYASRIATNLSFLSSSETASTSDLALALARQRKPAPTTS